VDYILNIQRGIPGKDQDTKIQKYVVPHDKYQNVLEALIHIYENEDSTLAFRMGCRYKTCGLCAMDINGTARMACLTKLSNDMTVKPLRNLPVIRDLVIDRRPFFLKLREYRIFIPHRDIRGLEQLRIPEDYRQLAKCRECLCCVSNYGAYKFGKSDFESPYIFVKIAQAHYDPRNLINRKEQAKKLGVERYRQGAKIPCPFGVPIFETAIAPFLGM
jgi:succinate dehydrogenase / fumarate reductase iron-sulfur subunit